MGFKKIQISAQNPKGLAFGFIEKRQFAAKTNRNSVFLGCKAHISDRLHITVPYISFFEFLKESCFGSKSTAAFGFTEKR
jgi:hypothetical protein